MKDSAILSRLICLVAGHRWLVVLVNWPKFIGLLHLHPLAGCWAICRRCRAEWDDLRYYGPARGCDRISACPKQLENWP